MIMSKTLKFPPDAFAGDVHHPANVIVRLTKTVSGLRAAWKAWRTYRNDVARLHAMDERMLNDIGLTRSEIGFAVRFGRHNH